MHQHLSNPCITSPTPPTLPHPGPPFPWLCSCYNESLEFMEALEDKLAPHLKGGWCSKGGGVGAASTRCSSAASDLQDRPPPYFLARRACTLCPAPASGPLRGTPLPPPPCLPPAPQGSRTSRRRAAGSWSWRARRPPPAWRSSTPTPALPTSSPGSTAARSGAPAAPPPASWPRWRTSWPTTSAWWSRASTAGAPAAATGPGVGVGWGVRVFGRGG